MGVPHGEVPFVDTFFRNIGWRGGPAPARIYIPDLLADVLSGSINPGLVFDYETDLDHVADAYAGHGRAAGHQVAGPGGLVTPSAREGGAGKPWTADQLARIGDADELRLAPRRTDGTLRPFTTMWVVRAGGDLYVRSAGGPERPWYRHALATQPGPDTRRRR